MCSEGIVDNITMCFLLYSSREAISVFSFLFFFFSGWREAYVVQLCKIAQHSSVVLASSRCLECTSACTALYFPVAPMIGSLGLHKLEVLFVSSCFTALVELSCCEFALTAQVICQYFQPLLSLI